MNYERHLIAFCILGETGNSIIVIKQEKNQVKCLKLFPGGNNNMIIPKKKFKQMISRKELESVNKLPRDVFNDFKLTWENNNRKLEESPIME